MRFLKTIAFAALVLSLIACDKGNVLPVENPETYTFERNGASTVSFTGQTTRIQMAGELASGLLDFDNASEEQLLQMYRNQTANGGDANPFSMAELNDSDKSVKSKVAASSDFFSANTADASLIKADFEDWISRQITEVFPAENEAAAAGVPGQIADGSAARYVNAQGLEYDQMVSKSLIGALMVDQALNNYLSTSVLDQAGNREDNDNEVLADGKNYTTMEHKWDEAYGYLYGTSPDPTNPNATIGEDDGFLNKYIGRAEGDSDFAGIAEEIFQAFKLGRAAIVAGDYELRDEQAAIIRKKISEVIGIRAVYYLQQGKNGIESSNLGAAFHDLSEGFGFIYGLQFTRIPGTNAPYFSKTEVDEFIDKMLADGDNGLWDVTPATLDEISESIANAFDFTLEQAAN